MSSFPGKFKSGTGLSPSGMAYLAIGIGSFFFFVVGITLGLQMGGSDLDSQIATHAKEKAALKTDMDKKDEKINFMDRQFGIISNELTKTTADLRERDARLAVFEKNGDDGRGNGRTSPTGGVTTDKLQRVFSEIRAEGVIPAKARESLQFDVAFSKKMADLERERGTLLRDYEEGKVARDLVRKYFQIPMDKDFFDPAKELDAVYFSEDLNGFNLFRSMPSGYFKKPYNGLTPDTVISKKIAFVNILCMDCNAKSNRDKDASKGEGKAIGGFIMGPDGRIFYQLIRHLEKNAPDLTAFIQDNRVQMLEDDRKLAKKGDPALAPADVDQFLAVLDGIRKLKTVLDRP